MHLKQFPSKGIIARTCIGRRIPFGSRIFFFFINGGGSDSVDLLSREDRSGINGRGGAKCSCQRQVVDSDVNAEVDMNGV